MDGIIRVSLRDEEILRGWASAVDAQWGLRGDEKALAARLEAREVERERLAEEERQRTTVRAVDLQSWEIDHLRGLMLREAREDGSGPLSEALLDKLIIRE